jgi:hypothetical protein
MPTTHLASALAADVAAYELGNQYEAALVAQNELGRAVMEAATTALEPGLHPDLRQEHMDTAVGLMRRWEMARATATELRQRWEMARATASRLRQQL